jgi:hypothetical protein
VLDRGEHGANLEQGGPSGSAAASIPTEATRWHYSLKLAEVEFADCAQCFCSRGILKVVRQALQPGCYTQPEVS